MSSILLSCIYREGKTTTRGNTDMIFEKTITVPAYTAKLIDRYIGVNPKSEDDCLSIDETIRNTAWTEAVLFKNGCEQDNILGEDEFFCDWEFEYDENEYIVHVIREDGADSE